MFLSILKYFSSMTYVGGNAGTLCLSNKSILLFQNVNGENMDCKMCSKKVEGEIIRAIGFVFHPDCFKCCICNQNLSNQEVPFTADKENRLYCQPCYNE